MNRTELANAIRVLSMDAVEKAKSGHPGAPMGMADIAEVLWNDYLKHNPQNPAWPNRDRFVLSNGHGSMLIYSLLHLSGYDLSMDELKNFRQLHSKTPGHPEFGYTPGVETTTGPLGQGISNAVGMALAEKLLAAEFNRDGYPIVDHYTYVFLGDGCLMEGISHETCALAGTWKLGKLIAFWDDNGISIDGHVEGWFSDDTPGRFRAYGWQVIADVDGHDPDAVKAAIAEARANKGQPTLICCRTVIGKGAPNKAGTHDVHGAPLGAAEVAATREALGWHHAPFEIPEAIYQHWDAKDRGQEFEKQWQNLFEKYQAAYPELAAEFTRRVIRRELPADYAEKTQAFLTATLTRSAESATRKSSQYALNGFCSFIPEMLGGSADLTGSNNTDWKGSKSIMPENMQGNYIHYGVREFGMAAIMNGIALHGGFIPYGGTFLIFSDYARNGIRMSALMRQRVIYVLTHDSIGLGEDGPTHQPVEQVPSLRLIPNLEVWRPCDDLETTVAWQCAIARQDGPSALALTRQNLPQQPHSAEAVAEIARGGYILKAAEAPQLLLLATGSEVALAMQAAAVLTEKGHAVQVVSLPCLERFEAQDAAYKAKVLPAGVKRLAIEMAATALWYRYVGLDGAVLGLDRFGESAPAKDLFKAFGFTVEHVVAMAEKLLAA
jgi:transketolase